MLRMVARLADVACAASRTEGEFAFGESRIIPFTNNLLSLETETTDRNHWCWIGEDKCPASGGADMERRHGQVRASIASEGIAVSFDRDRKKIAISRTTEGSCPIYLSAVDDTLTASWRYEDVIAPIPRPAPDLEACRLYLEQGPSRVRNQVIAGTVMLWPGEAVTFSQRGLEFSPNEREIVRPTIFTDGARATDEFIELVSAALRLAMGRGSKTLIEISGGLDSSVVAIAASSAYSNLHSYGLIHQGAVAEQQRNRRKELIELTKIRDFEYPSDSPSPFAALSYEECSYTHNDDNHRLVCAHAVDLHPDGPFDVIVTGIGGDELSLEDNDLYPEYELPGSVCTSSIVASMARADMFMRRGIWVKNPLSSQIVVDFCRALPRKFREKRLLNILLLARAGLSDGFLFPRYSEHYGHGMQREAALLDFDEMLAQSHVADHGISDIGPLLQRARDASYGGFSYKLITEIWNLLKLEKILGRYIP